MLIDIIYLVLLALAVFKGYRRGLIASVFSIIALLIGLAAAMKLSAVMAGYLQGSLHLSARWISVIAFVAVFALAAFLVALVAKLIQRAAETVMLGWLNRLGGFVLYALLYTVILSVVLFYLEKLKLLRADVILASATYTFIKPFGPAAINSLGVVIPFFQNLFADLERFFSSMATPAK